MGRGIARADTDSLQFAMLGGQTSDYPGDPPLIEPSAHPSGKKEGHGRRKIFEP